MSLMLCFKAEGRRRKACARLTEAKGATKAAAVDENLMMMMAGFCLEEEEEEEKGWSF